ncbi:hypothetical protein EJ02DRAFT_264120 [Clathrospora elynae]|uniref:BTB domain-containing protein n=1 Tax=Clathrospora elynae TaxID=706981 RepID=A0A6A5SEY8_9PLEO|nr:hypothetical protein EJ02DRAFT_264120 [Clathrospora elynae]
MAGPTKEGASGEEQAKMEDAPLDLVMAKRGDVVIELSKDGKAAGTLLVSSQVLSLGSPVFEAMFSGRFAEGQSLSAESSPRLVPLPDDNPHSMILICKIAHLQTAGLPEQLSFTAFADFAVACDKYQCSEAVQAWSKIWATGLMKMPNSLHFEKLLFATYVLDIPLEFGAATLILIRDRKPIVNLTNATHGHHFLPMNLFDKLLLERCKGEEVAYVALHHVTADLGACDRSQRTIGHLIINLRAAGVWPVGTMSLKQLNQGVKAMGELPESHCRCMACGDSSQIKEGLVTEIKKAYSSRNGLCLDCIKRDAHGDTRVCRIRHEGAITATA